MWCGQIEATLLKYCQDFETLVTEFNQFGEHVDSQLKLVGTHIDTWGHHLVAFIKVTPPVPSVEVQSDFEAKVWEAIAEIRANTQRQSSVLNPPPVDPMPSPCIALLTNQVATLQGEIEYLRQRFSDPDDFSSDSDGKREAEVTGTLLCSEVWHRHTPGNSNLRIGFVLSLS
ncbi:hypothetical protein DSO57_1013791 [Entomophthora muscae]|uniref:Uncharacterized protein n=1 Tax=Entomophthora muscae TaxID=34485 RepID=A0ACC2S7D7_9FUNG|nr:hypothetical protein DSO57_1013791 [Entomophthora muscae]